MTRAFWAGRDWLDPIVDINAGERAETEHRHARRQGALSDADFVLEMEEIHILIRYMGLPHHSH